MRVAVRPGFWPIRFFPVMQVHPILDKTSAVVKMQERIAVLLFCHGRGRRDTVIMAWSDQGIAR